MALRWIVSLSLLVACGGEAPSLTCGPGTMRSGDQCVRIDDPEADAAIPEDPPIGLADGGTPADPTEDAGSGWGVGGPVPPGCDEAAGECDAWETELVAALQASCPGLAVEPGIGAVADAHTAYQAQVDRIAAESPDGTIFEQLEASGVDYDEAAVLFSVTRSGAEDVIERWRESGSSAAILGRCFTHAGVAFHTSETGASYTTVIFVVR